MCVFVLADFHLRLEKLKVLNGSDVTLLPYMCFSDHSFRLEEWLVISGRRGGGCFTVLGGSDIVFTSPVRTTGCEYELGITIYYIIP